MGDIKSDSFEDFLNDLNDNSNNDFNYEQYVNDTHIEHRKKRINELLKFGIIDSKVEKRFIDLDCELKPKESFDCLKGEILNQIERFQIEYEFLPLLDYTSHLNGILNVIKSQNYVEELDEYLVDDIIANPAYSFDVFDENELLIFKGIQNWINDIYLNDTVKGKVEVETHFKWNKTKQQLAELVLALHDSNVFKDPNKGETASIKDIERLFEQITGESFDNINNYFNGFRNTITNAVKPKTNRLLTNELLENIKRRMEIKD